MAAPQHTAILRLLCALAHCATGGESEILALAREENFRVNLIEAYDQPWKRQLEGTVGGYWGLISSEQRALKYPPNEPIRNYPLWKWQMGGGMVLSLLVFGAAALTLRRRPWTPRPASWICYGTGYPAGVSGQCGYRIKP